MPTIFAKEAGDHAWPFAAFKPCLGPICMVWAWEGPAADRCETDNLVETEDGVRPLGSPSTPAGEGWEMDGGPFPKGYHRSAKDRLPTGTGQRWVRRRQAVEGHCARGAGDYCGPW